MVNTIREPSDGEEEVVDARGNVFEGGNGGDEARKMCLREVRKGRRHGEMCQRKGRECMRREKWLCRKRVETP